MAKLLSKKGLEHLGPSVETCGVGPRPKPCRERCRGGGALFGVHVQGIEDQRLDLAGKLRDDLARWQELALDDPVHHGEVVVAEKGTAANGELVQQHTQPEYIAAPIERDAFALLGRHVADLALERARAGLLRLLAETGDAEVQQLDRAIEGDHDVGRRDIAMDEATAVRTRLVRVVQARGNGLDDAHTDRQRHRLRPLPLTLQGPDRLAMHVFHREEVAAIADAVVEDAHDIGVVQRGDDADFVEEHADELRVPSQVGEHPFEGDGVALAVAGHREVQLRHPADRKRTDDRVRPQSSACREAVRFDLGAHAYVHPTSARIPEGVRQLRHHRHELRAGVVGQRAYPLLEICIELTHDAVGGAETGYDRSQLVAASRQP